MYINGERIVLPTRSSSREVGPHYCSDCIKGNVNLLKWIKMISYCTESANYFEWMWTISSISLNSFPIMIWRTINIRLALWIVGTLLHPSKIFNGIKVKFFRQSLDSIVYFLLHNVKTKRTFKTRWGWAGPSSALAGAWSWNLRFRFELANVILVRSLSLTLTFEFEGEI